MAKKQNDRNVAKKKFSYNERVEYHTSFVKKVFDTCKKSGDIDYRKLEKALNSNSKIQYSDGFSDFAAGIGRGYIEPDSELKKRSIPYQKGHRAAKRAWEKSKNLKF